MVRHLGKVLAFAAVTCFATVAFAAIAGSDHDFSNDGWSGGEICVVCHTPHNADTSVSDAPLWNHTLTNSVFTLYSSATLDAAVGQPNGISKLCLSCHDGTVALDSFGGNVGGTFMGANSDKNLGIDLSNDHPVSFDYNAALAAADGELLDPSATQSGLGSTIDADMLFSGRMECASCHAVHDPTNDPFLRKSNAGSALCLTCHDK